MQELVSGIKRRRSLPVDQLKERRTYAGWRDRHWPRAYTTRLAFPCGIGEALGLISC
jgi:hypothetical protein